MFLDACISGIFSYLLKLKYWDSKQFILYAIPLVLITFIYLLGSVLKFQEKYFIEKKILTVIKWIPFVLFGFLFIESRRFILIFQYNVVGIVIFSAVWTLIISIKNKNKLSIFLFVSFVPIFALSIFNIFTRLGLLNSEYYIWNSFKIGIFFQSILFSILVSVRVRQMSQKIQKREFGIEKKVERKTLELSGTIKELEKKETEYNLEINLAYELQKSLIPKNNKIFPLIDFSYYCEFPVKIGGDFFDIIDRKEKGIAVYIADASGHGIAASLLTFMYRTAFSNTLLKSTSPSDTFREVNLQSTNVFMSYRYLTSFLLFLDPSGNLSYSSAGHRPAFLYRRKTNLIEILSTKGFFLGMEKTGFVVEEKTTTMEIGDRILLYSDGILDAKNIEDQSWSMENLLETFSKSQGKPLQASLDYMTTEWKNFIKDSELMDDSTFLLLEFRG